MKAVCLDLEGVLVPEIWIAFSEVSGIPELSRTTRDEPDYDLLMRQRIDILREHGLGLAEIQATIEKIDPMPGAREFLDQLRELTQVIIISDTFSQFAKPLMRKLGWPTIFCNELIVGEDGMINDFAMRCEDTKLTTVRALHSCGIETIASGDSFNDVGMILNSQAGFFFRTIDALREQYPDVAAYETYDELLEAIKAAL
jgi:phosphoserine/homoserine phosphotransferase